MLIGMARYKSKCEQSKYNMWCNSWLGVKPNSSTTSVVKPRHLKWTQPDVSHKKQMSKHSEASSIHAGGQGASRTAVLTHFPASEQEWQTGSPHFFRSQLNYTTARNLHIAKSPVLIHLGTGAAIVVRSRKLFEKAIKANAWKCLILWVLCEDSIKPKYIANEKMVLLKWKVK